MVYNCIYNTEFIAITLYDFLIHIFGFEKITIYNFIYHDAVVVHYNSLVYL